MSGQQLGSYRLLSELGSGGMGTVHAAEVTEARVNEILQNLYGREMATEQVAPPSIWYAFKIRRTWNKTMQRTSWTDQGKIVGYEGDYKEGGTYTVLGVQANNAAVYPAGSWSSVATALAESLRGGGKTFSMPTHTKGFAPSNIRTLL